MTKKEILEILESKNAQSDYFGEDRVYYLNNDCCFISTSLDACFQEVASVYEEELQEYDFEEEEIALRREEGVQTPEVWQCMKYRALNGDKKMLIEKINDYYIVTIIK